jgi:hypothetical protein
MTGIRLQPTSQLIASALLFVPLGGCFYAGDAHTRSEVPLTADVFHWTVVDEASQNELGHGCGLLAENRRLGQVRFSAPVGSRIVETVLFELVEKDRNQFAPEFFPDNASLDAAWCAAEHDVRREPDRQLRPNIACLRADTKDPRGPVANITSYAIIPAGPGRGGYRMGFEILRPGTLYYEEDPGCSVGWTAEFSVLP